MSPNELFSRAKSALDDGTPSVTADLAKQLEELVGPHPAIHHLHALALRASGDDASADEQFLKARALDAPPGDPFIYANHASLQEAMGQIAQAAHSYETAVARAPSHAEISLARIAFIHRQFGEDAAADAFRQLSDRFGGSIQLHIQHAIFLHKIDRCKDALRAVDQALALDSRNTNALQLKARLKLDCGQNACADYLEAIKICADKLPLMQGFAAAIWHEQGPLEALDFLDRQLEKTPQWVEGWTLRARIAWQNGMPEEAAGGFITARSKLPGNAELMRSELAFLAKSQGPEAALRMFKRPQDFDTLDEETRSFVGDLASQNGEFELADQLFGRVSHSGQSCINFVRHRIRTKRYQDALALAEEQAMGRGITSAWVYVWTLWRLLDDERLDWLNADERLINVVDFPDFSSLFADLPDTLRSLHKRMAQHPFEQSPRGGTQTDGHLFASAEPQILELREQVLAAVNDMVRGLPPIDKSHPVLGAKRHQVQFAGSWSIRLEDAGYHEAHFHSEGWYSSALYVALPDALGAVSDQPDGWLELGSPPQDLNVEIEPIRLIKPEIGRLALFPSILWHGTRPFDQGERLTVAFDVTPVS